MRTSSSLGIEFLMFDQGRGCDKSVGVRRASQAQAFADMVSTGDNRAIHSLKMAVQSGQLPDCRSFFQKMLSKLQKQISGFQ
jgi:hypothetical protein